MYSPTKSKDLEQEPNKVEKNFLFNFEFIFLVYFSSDRQTKPN